ncbi:MAG: hypothetical protein Q8Q47_12515 [Ignavibacteriaceae bacterium]|nr:hypothetical protein [Ignavibacteriaceae bacterium]
MAFLILHFIIYNFEFLIDYGFLGFSSKHSFGTIPLGKANTILGYEPEYDAKKGFEMAVEWYYENLS